MTALPGALEDAMALKLKRFSSRVKYIVTPSHENMVGLFGSMDSTDRTDDKSSVARSAGI